MVLLPSLFASATDRSTRISTTQAFLFVLLFNGLTLFDHSRIINSKFHSQFLHSLLEPFHDIAPFEYLCACEDVKRKELLALADNQ